MGTTVQAENTSVNMGDLAVAYAQEGLEVIPLNGKVPRSRHGFKDATTDTEDIGKWWHRWPTANIGVRVPVGYVVVDIDPRNGGTDTWEQLRGGREVPDTMTTLTGSGGLHIWFRLPRVAPLRSNAGEGVDLKGNNGYVVIPGSVHPHTGKDYVFLSETTPAMLPPWLESVVYRTPEVARRTVRSGRQGDRNGLGLVRAVGEAVEGTRNGILFWAACQARRDGLDIDQLLWNAAIDAGLSEGEAGATIRSAAATVGGAE